MTIINIIIVIILIMILILCLWKFVFKGGYNDQSRYFHEFSNLGFAENHESNIKVKLNSEDKHYEEKTTSDGCVERKICKTIYRVPDNCFKKLLIVSDIHGAIEMLTLIKNKLAIEPDLHIMFLGDLFHRYERLNDSQTIELCEYFLTLMDSGKLTWIIGNHDFLQFYISNLILCETENPNKNIFINKENLPSLLLNLIDGEKRRDQAIKMLIQNSIDITYNNMEIMKEFINRIKAGEIKYYMCIGNICFSHSTIFKNSPTNEKFNDIIKAICKQDINLDDTIKGFINPFDLEKVLWPNGDYKRVKYFKSETKPGFTQDYVIDDIKYIENFIGHSNVYSKRLCLTDGINKSQNILCRNSTKYDTAIQLIESLRADMLKGFNNIFSDKGKTQQNYIHYCDMCNEFEVKGKYYSKLGYVKLIYDQKDKRYEIIYGTANCRLLTDINDKHLTFTALSPKILLTSKPKRQSKPKAYKKVELNLDANAYVPPHLRHTA